MSKLLLVIGICQIVAGAIIVGLVGKDFNDVVQNKGFAGVGGSTDADKVEAFGPVLIGILVIVNGVFGVMTICCGDNKKMDVFYVIGAAVAASASAAMLWIYALRYYRCEKGITSLVCTQDSKDVYISLITFSTIACAMSVFGMVSAALSTCRRL